MSDDGVFGSRAAILGHRGCGRGVVDGYVENTLASFLAAVELGLDWVEVDVRRTSDDVLVVTHDPARDDGVFYGDLTGEQAVAGNVLRLEALLEALPPHVGVDFDVKSDLADAQRHRLRTTTGLLAPIAARQALRRPTLITSFDPGGLAIARELAPGVPRGLLTWVDFPAGHAVAAAAHLDVQVLALHRGSLKPNKIEREHLHYPLPRIVEAVHGAGLELMAWCPGVTFSRELLAAGADALCVNDVPRLVAELTATAGSACTT
jgi:glycerophosphoryl diester phosphodiesterase